MVPELPQPDKDNIEAPSRKKTIKKQKNYKNYKAFKLVWARIEPLLPVKNVLILPGDCIIPLNNISMLSLIEQLYTKNSSLRDGQHLQLTLTRKVKPFRSFQQLFPLLKNIYSQYVPMLKEIIAKDYTKYIQNKKEQRRLVTLQSSNAVIKSARDFDRALENYLQNLPQKYYRYQVRSSNQDKQMQMKRVGISKHLIKLLEPQSTDILLKPAPRIFKDMHNYLKYMYYNLLSLVQGGEMGWVDIDLETEDQIVIQTCFKNVYFSTPYSTRLVTITMFQIPKHAISKIQEIRKQSHIQNENILRSVNPQAQLFFNKFYQEKGQKKKSRCEFQQIKFHHFKQ